MKYPRMLHVGFQPIGSPDNSGLTLASVFGDWPPDRLMQLCLRDHPDAPLGHQVHIAPPSVAPVDGLVRSVLGKHVPKGAVDGLNNSVSRRGQTLSLKQRVRIFATTVNDIGPVRLPSSAARHIRSFEPQAVHSLLGGVRAMRLALLVSTRFDVPIVPHFMDDWPLNLFADGRLWGYPRRAVLRDLESVLARSPVALTIGAAMNAEFQERYQIPCAVVGNSIDVDHYRAVSQSHPPPDGAPVLRYVGGLHLGRDALLDNVGRAFMATSRRPWTIELFVPPADAGVASRLAADHPNIVDRGSLAPDAVPAALTSSTAQVFVESSDPDIARFTRLSVSTKVPQYLAAGRPVLVIGNADQGSVKTLLDSPLGVYGGSGSAADLASAVQRVEELVRDIPRHAAEVEAFDVRATRERLRVWSQRAVDEWAAR